jgi:hypothetical protein
MIFWFFFIWGMLLYSTDSSKMVGFFTEVLNFNWLAVHSPRSLFQAQSES